MYLTHIFSDFLLSTLQPVIWLKHPAASTRSVARRLLPFHLPGSWFVFLRSVSVLWRLVQLYMCCMPIVLCCHCRRKSKHDNNLRIYEKISSNGLHFRHEGNTQQTRATWWPKTGRINDTVETPSKRIAGTTCTANGHSRIISANLN